MYLLDTNVISEMRLIAKNKANPNVTRWVKSQNADNFYLNSIVMMELEKGILLKYRRDPTQAKILETWFKTVVIHNFKERTFIIDNHIAEICATLHIPDKKADNDAWIGATAIAHDLILVTRNVDDFAGMPVKIFNPFDR